jgi:hypothetical protein
MTASEAARALRAIQSESRSAASRENGKKGGRPKGSKNKRPRKGTAQSIPPIVPSGDMASFLAELVRG